MRERKIVTTEMEFLLCDRCKLEMPVDITDIEYTESFSISFRGGYGSVFGDGSVVEGDFCQSCIKDVLGEYLKVTEDHPFDPKYFARIKAHRACQPSQVAGADQVVREERKTGVATPFTKGGIEF